MSAEDAASVALRVEDLSVSFRNRGTSTRVVRSVSFQLRAAETLVLLGESGSGKSVTARAILRLYGRNAEVTGEVALHDRSLLGLDEKQMRTIRGAKIALVPQDPTGALDPMRRVGKQIAEVLLLHNRAPSRAAARAQAIDLLRLVGIPDPRRVSRSYPHELSGGMRQRVVIAIAISCDPAVIIADEPTTALDATVQAQILRLFAELQQRVSSALLMVTHDVLVAADIADVVAVMYAGRIVEIGPAEQVLDHPRHPYTSALIGALPRPGTPRGALAAIVGSPPVAGEQPTGCAFAARCPVVEESCHDETPPLVGVGPRHLAACPVVKASRSASNPNDALVRVLP
jgi:oligopeptide/dipeptide ABC transporter ATP-binding protein